MSHILDKREKPNICRQIFQTTHNSEFFDLFEMSVEENSDVRELDPNARYLRAQFTLVNDRTFLPIETGDVFLVRGRTTNGHLDAENMFTEERGCIPRPSSAVYVTVKPFDAAFPQPIVLIGSLRQYVQDLLLQQEPDAFATPLPHTTRPQRASERNGVDYMFVRDSTMNMMIRGGLFVECGSINGYLYGTTEAAVKSVLIKEKKHCLLDISSTSLRLMDRGLYPIVIFVGANNSEQLREVMQFEGVSDDDIKREFCQDEAEMQKSNYCLNGYVNEASLDDAYSRVKELIERNASVPFHPVLKRGDKKPSENSEADKDSIGYGASECRSESGIWSKAHSMENVLDEGEETSSN